MNHPSSSKRSTPYAIRYTRIENPVIYVPIRHYICRGPSTNQLLFMQNKPNLPDVQMNLNFYPTRYYENLPIRRRVQNKPNQTQSKPVLSAACPERSRMGRMGQFPKGQNEQKPEKLTQLILYSCISSTSLPKGWPFV